MNPNDDTPSRDELADEILIGRLVDGEADHADERRFEEIAAGRPGLWRTLAMRQRDMMVLADQVEAETERAARVELHGKSILPKRLSWTLAMSGWAAMLLVALTWAGVVLVSGVRDEGLSPVRGDGAMPLPPPPQISDLAPRELLEAYKSSAEWNVRELGATLEQMITLEDGSLLVRGMRRFDEELIIPPDIAARLREAQQQGREVPVDMIELVEMLERLGWSPEEPDRESS